MIKIEIKRIVFLVTSFLVAFSINAQTKYGFDEQLCKENLSMFREYYKQKSYADALSPWRWTFLNCPESNGNIYKNGPKIIKERMKVDFKNKSSYIDTLMLIFDNRIKYFGKEGYVLGLKGYELISLDKNRSDEGLAYLKKSLDLDGDKASVYAVYGYMKAIVNLEKSGNKTRRDVLEAYALLSEIIDFNIINESKTTKSFVQYSKKIENLFTPYANCEDLIAMFSQNFESLSNNLDALNRITKLLDKKKCSNSNLFFKASNRLYELNPSAQSADRMSKMSITKGKYSNAIKFALQAVEMEEEVNKKAIYYLALADAYRNKGSYSLARKAVYNALEIRKNWGQAYINLGNIYISGAKSCTGNFEQSTVYWVAVDAFKKALSDEDTKLLASKSINTYSKYFPTKEKCFFNGVDLDKPFTVECWINKKTLVRTID